MDIGGLPITLNRKGNINNTYYQSIDILACSKQSYDFFHPVFVVAFSSLDGANKGGSTAARVGVLSTNTAGTAVIAVAVPQGCAAAAAVAVPAAVVIAIASSSSLEKVIPLANSRDALASIKG